MWSTLLIFVLSAIHFFSSVLTRRPVLLMPGEIPVLLLSFKIPPSRSALVF